MSTKIVKGPEPKVDLDATRQLLQRVGLLRGAERLEELMTLAVKEELSPHRLVDALLGEELSFREDRRIRTSLLLSGLHDTARVMPMFVGLVEPSFDAAKKWEDVQKLAALTASWIGRARTDLIAAELRPEVEKLRSELQHIGSSEAKEAVPIQLLTHRFSRTLALLDHNFGGSRAR